MLGQEKKTASEDLVQVPSSGYGDVEEFPKTTKEVDAVFGEISEDGPNYKDVSTAEFGGLGEEEEEESGHADQEIGRLDGHSYSDAEDANWIGSPRYPFDSAHSWHDPRCHHSDCHRRHDDLVWLGRRPVETEPS